MQRYAHLGHFEQRFLKRGFRRVLRRKALLSLDRDKRRKIKAILNDDFLQEAVLSEAVEKYNAFEDGETPIVDGLLRLLQWIVDNWDTIQEIIEVIIGLFGEED